MRFALLVAVALAGCDALSRADYPDTAEVLANVPEVLTEGEPVPLRGTVRGDHPAVGLMVELRAPGSGPCREPACGFVWGETVELPPSGLPQRIDTAVTLPDTLVDAPTTLELAVLGVGENGARGSTRAVTVRPAE